MLILFVSIWIQVALFNMKREDEMASNLLPPMKFDEHTHTHTHTKDDGFLSMHLRRLKYGVIFLGCRHVKFHGGAYI